MLIAKYKGKRTHTHAHTEVQLFLNNSCAGPCVEEPWWRSTGPWLPAAAMGREGWMSARTDAVPAHTLQQELLERVQRGGP